MVYPAWPQFSAGAPPTKWWPRWMDPFDPTFQLAWLNTSFTIIEGATEVVPEPMFNGVWLPLDGLASAGSIWDAFNISTMPNLGLPTEPRRSMGFPLRWGLSRGIKMKDNGGEQRIP